MTIRELTFDEVDMVSGGKGKACRDLAKWVLESAAWDQATEVIQAAGRELEEAGGAISDGIGKSIARVVDHFAPEEVADGHPTYN